MPFELVDSVVDDARARERRLRLLPSRTGVYFLLAMCLFPRSGYLAVWGRLTSALDGPGLGVPSAKALRDLRRRIGAAPVRALFEVLAGPLGRLGTPGIMFGGYRTVAFGGCKSVKVPDTAANSPVVPPSGYDCCDWLHYDGLGWTHGLRAGVDQSWR